MELLVVVIVCAFVLPFLAAIVMVAGLIATAIAAGFLYLILWLAQVIGLSGSPN